ncbi:hypothetical protein ACFL20_04730 [Spirochaetota bacterium]
MENVSIWYLTDNEHGKEIVISIQGLGLPVNMLTGTSFKEANVNENEINVFIIDLVQEKPLKIIEMITGDKRLANFTKYLILKKDDIEEVAKSSYNIMHLEFMRKPVEKREFLLLIEKSIIIERYREIMKYIASEAEMRIETYEGLLDINRKNIIDSDKEIQAFQKIIDYEKNLIKEQANLNLAIKDFSLLRQQEMEDMKNRIVAEEMLSDLRRKELMDAKKMINAQESLINFSVGELYDAKKIIYASESVAELGRSEAIGLHKELEDIKEENVKLKEEVKKLKGKKK